MVFPGKPNRNMPKTSRLGPKPTENKISLILQKIVNSSGYLYVMKPISTRIWLTVVVM